MLLTTIEKIALLGKGPNDFAKTGRRNQFSKEAWQTLNSLVQSETALVGAIPMLDIYKAVGLIDALWCLETIETQQGHDRDLALFGLALCRHYIEPHIACNTIIDAINVAEQYAKGLVPRDTCHAALCQAEDAEKKHQNSLPPNNGGSSNAFAQHVYTTNALGIIWITDRGNFELPNHRDPTKTGRAIAAYAVHTVRRHAQSSEDQTPNLLFEALLKER